MYLCTCMCINQFHFIWFWSNVRISILNDFWLPNQKTNVQNQWNNLGSEPSAGHCLSTTEEVEHVVFGLGDIHPGDKKDLGDWIKYILEIPYRYVVSYVVHCCAIHSALYNSDQHLTKDQGVPERGEDLWNANHHYPQFQKCPHLRCLHVLQACYRVQQHGCYSKKYF